MHKSQLHYQLPPELIAKFPTTVRSSSRLLHVMEKHAGGDHSVCTEDLLFSDLPQLLRPNDLIVLNDSRVLPARLLLNKATGGKVEILIEKILDNHTANVLIKSSKPVAEHSFLYCMGEKVIRVRRRHTHFYIIEVVSGESVRKLISRIGTIPIPKYLKRAVSPEDSQRYQTIFSKVDGSIAAPTAGLHFDHSLLQKLQDNKVATAYLTLHIGIGTFAPIRTDDIDKHEMHTEEVQVSESVCRAVRTCRRKNGRVVAVGTSAIRALETAAQIGKIQPFHGKTNLFIKPGFPFQVADMLITNFHLPASTLLVLVYAFSGEKTMRQAYQHAISQRYRFYSYGDAVLLHRAPLRNGQKEKK